MASVQKWTEAPESPIASAQLWVEAIGFSGQVIFIIYKMVERSKEDYTNYYDIDITKLVGGGSFTYVFKGK